MPVVPLYEVAGDESPCTVSATIEDGKSTRLYDLFPTTNQDLVDTVNWIVGGTSVAIGDGKLNRTLPPSDPVFTGWPARAVQGLKGIGAALNMKGTNLPALDSTGLVPIERVVNYSQYRLTIEFGPRPYPVLSDNYLTPLVSDFVTARAFDWYLSNGNLWGNIARFWPEWWRYCWWSPELQNDWVTAQSGQLVFVRDGGAAPNNFPFVGMPRMFLPNDLVTFNWDCVPYRYITSKNSYIRRCRGLVNAFNFYETTQGVDFAPGSLLYLTAKVTPYSPPLQSSVDWNSFVKALPKLCNLQLVFLRTDRFATNPPVPNNQNFKVHGHNALPWLGGINTDGTPMAGGRLFYYSNMGGGTEGTPSFISAPIPHLLFQDPDSPGCIPMPPEF